MNRTLVVVAVLLSLAAVGATWFLLGGPSAVSAGVGPADLAAAGPAPDNGPDAGVRDPEREASARASAGSDGVAAALDPSEAALVETGLLAVRFLVVDEQGEPIEDARVELEGSETTRSETTDAAGTCLLGLEPASRRLSYTVEAEGYLHEKDSEGLEEEVRVRLYRVARLAGRVLDEASGAPVAGARVRLPDGHDDCPAEAVPTGPDGSFELGSVPVGRRFDVRVDAEGYADHTQRYHLPSTEDLPALTLHLERSVDVRLRFVDFESRRPVSGALLQNKRELGESDESGELDVSSLVTGGTERLFVNARAPGFLTVSGNVTSRGWRETGVAEVPLLRGAHWEGRVFDEAGEPVSGASVSVRFNRWTRRRSGENQGPLPDWPREWRLGQESSSAVKSDASGAYVSSAVPPGSAGSRLIVSKEGFSNRVLQLEAAPAPGQVVRKDVTLTRREGGRVVGRLSLNGEPVRGRVYWVGPKRSGSGSARGDGAFELKQVEPGAVRLSATVERTGMDLGDLLREVEVEVEVVADQEHAQDVALEVGWAPIRGVVLGPGGRGAGGLEVQASHDEFDARARAWTDADGLFELSTPVSEGLWEVGLRRGDGVPEQQVAAGTGGLEFRLEETGVLRVRVLDALTRRPLDDFDVYRIDPASGSAGRLVDTGRNATDPAGWCYARAPIGPAELLVVPDDVRQPTAVAACVVPPPEEGEVRVELILELGYELVLHLTGEGTVDRRRTYVLVLEEDIAEALPPPSANVNQFSEIARRLPGSRSWRSRRITLGNDTNALVPGLKAGRYRIVSVMGAFAFEPNSFELPLAEPGPIEVTWKVESP